jgi:hypothetical protein
MNLQFQPILLLICSVFLIATDKPTLAPLNELKEAIAKMDTATCSMPSIAHDVDRLMALFTDNLEFYHDKVA